MTSRTLQTLCASGELERAMEILARTHTPLPPNAYLALLKACKHKRFHAFSHVHQIHSHIIHHRVPLSGLLGDYLIVTLSVCGAVDDALHTSSALPHRSVFSWTAIISGYMECGCADRALTTYQDMLKDGVEPSSQTFHTLFKACGSILELDRGRDLHAYACMKGLASDVIVGNAIVNMYSDCGAIVEAENVFAVLPEHTLASWNSLLFACFDQGQAKKAIQLYAQMQLDGVEPSHYTFLTLFKACTSILDLKQGETLHSQARKQGLVSDVVVGSTLISMYGKCGAIMKAEDVFGDSPDRDVVSWNAMLSAYVEQGHGRKALFLYRQMQAEGVSPTHRTFVIALRACITLAEKEEVLQLAAHYMKIIPFSIGRALHADAGKNGFLSHSFFHNTLVSMYGKCRAISEAEDVFGALSDRDLVSWNAMLSAYAECGQGESALRLFSQMDKEGMISDQATFVTVFHAVALVEGEEAPLSEGRFSRLMSLEIGHALHGFACKYSLTLDDFVGSAIVSMYGRCGSIAEAENVFCGLSQRTVVSWNAMLSAYIEQGQGEKALRLNAQMQVEGINPSEITYILALQACGSLVENDEILHEHRILTKTMVFNIAQAIHADFCRKHFTTGVSVGNTLVSLYGKCGAIVEAENLFCDLPRDNVVSWNTMLSAYIEHGEGEKALLLYAQRQAYSLSPDLLTYVCVLQACADLAEKDEDPCAEGQSAKVIAMKIGRALHVECDAKGFASHAFIGNSLVRMYGKCGAIVEAEEVFRLMSSANGCKKDHGFGCLENEHTATFSTQDVVCLNVMLSAYAENGYGHQALQLYRQMQKQGVSINLVSITRTLQACSNAGSIEICKQLHFAVVSGGFDRICSVAATLIHAYGSCASMVDAQASLRGMLEPDIIAWNACIAGYAGEGNAFASLYMLEKLRLTAAEPNETTFNSVLSACCQSGLVSGFYYFDSMTRYYCLTAESKHYCSLLDLLGRAGDFKRIEDMLERMPTKRSPVVWLSLLGACRTHGNTLLAKRAYDHAVGLQPNHATAYVLMSNVYADADMQEEYHSDRIHVPV